jgi:hypothetical protein
MQTFTNSTTTIPLVFPRGWDPATLTAVTLQIADKDANELQAATATALYTAAALATGGADQFASSFTLAAGAGALIPGDFIRLSGVSGYEDHVVKGYDATTRTVVIELVLGRDFEAGAKVYRLSTIATVDFSDTDDYPPGIQLVLTWTPTGSGDVFTERAEIDDRVQLDVAELSADFAALYPRAWQALKEPQDRFDRILRMAQDELRLVLSSRGLDPTRLVDQRLLSPPLMATLARFWLINGDEKMEDERKILESNYSAQIERLCNLPVWVDSDIDGVEDTDETTSHPQQYERVW